MTDYIRKTFTYEGKRYYVRGKTEKEAYEKMFRKQKDLESNVRFIDSSMTVKDWALKAWDVYYPSEKEITRQRQLGIMQATILNYIGSYRLKDIRPLQLQELLNRQSGHSQYLINRTCQMLKFIFSKAFQNGLIISNPAEFLVKPSGTKNSRRSITDDERKNLVKVCNEDPVLQPFLIMLYTGARPSEALHIMGSDVSCDPEPMLHIRGTKTKSSDRYVPLVPEAYEILKDVPKDQYAFTKINGKVHDEDSYKRLRERLRREMNISMGCKVYRNKLVEPFPLADDFSPYCLRHTFCSDLCKAGVDIRIAQKLMGHASIEMTANIYTHVDKDSLIDAIHKLR